MVHMQAVDAYMALVGRFLGILSDDAKLRKKTAGLQASFQVTFTDNEEGFCIIFDGGEIEASLGAYPRGPADVGLRLPIAVFDGMMRGTVNGAKAAMAGQMSFTGSARDSMRMQPVLKLMMKPYQAAAAVE